MTERSWHIEVEQGDVKVGSVELIADAENCKVFIIRPQVYLGFGATNFYAHGACYAVLLGFGSRVTETCVALRGDTVGWHSFVHTSADGVVWTLVRWRRPETVWEAPKP